MSITLERHLAELTGALERRAAGARRLLRGAVAGFFDEDRTALSAVASGSSERGRYEVERLVATTLACSAPVATDLRAVIAAAHVNHNLLRIADLSRTIARLAELTGPGSCPAPVRDEMVRMAARADEMVGEALAAYAARDVVRARRLVELDDLLDSGNRRVVAVLARSEVDGAGDRERGLLATLVARCLERVGDNAVDVGEQVHYLVTGEALQFEDASHPGRRAA